MSVDQMELNETERARTRKQITQYIAGQLPLSEIGSWARDRAIAERFKALERRIAWLEGAFMQAINAADGDADHDAEESISF